MSNARTASELAYETHLLPGAGWCPNNARLPLIVYRAVHAAEDGAALAVWFEERFAVNGWPPAWRYTIYPYAHFHSMTHEVVGIFRGQANIRMGDTSGVTIACQAGDVLLIPAGVSHQRIDGSEDFQGVGAYPEGFEPDEIRNDAGENSEVTNRIAHLPIPSRDPLGGIQGPLREEWK